MGEIVEIEIGSILCSERGRMRVSKKEKEKKREKKEHLTGRAPNDVFCFGPKTEKTFLPLPPSPSSLSPRPLPSPIERVREGGGGLFIRERRFEKINQRKTHDEKKNEPETGTPPSSSSSSLSSRPARCSPAPCSPASPPSSSAPASCTPARWHTGGPSRGGLREPRARS